MVINIDAFRKSFTDPEKENKANLIHRSNDKMNGMRPIDLIAETSPFVIIDEPQSVDTTPKSKEAIASLNPLCTLRYSATHVDKHNCVYKLDAIDAFNLNLVKQIEVASFSSTDYHNRAYMLLKSVDNKKSPITAKIEIDALVNGEVKRKVVTVKQGSDLSEKLSGNRAIYEGYIVDEIYCEKGEEYVSFTMKPEVLRIGRAVGEFDDTAIKEQQIRKTIEEHLNKALVLSGKGVKVLSLFFIDRVANYRYYDDDGNAHQGKYAQLFEKHYKELVRRPKYKKLIDSGIISDDEAVVHNGYFSVDKKGVFKDTNGTTTLDDDVYNLIMKDKEKLLSFDSKLQFIFSHSALREGWDKPASDKKTIKLNKQIYLNPEFKELWDKIKYKTSYSVSFDSAELIRKCSEEMKNNLNTSSAKLIYSKAEIKHTEGGLETTEKVHTAVSSGEETKMLPDIVTYLQANTSLHVLLSLIRATSAITVYHIYSPFHEL